MRRKDLSGEKVWIGADELMSSRMVEMLVAWKMDGSLRLVIMRVLLGGVGGWKGGTEERSRERGVREREDDVELGPDMVIAVVG